MTWSWTEVAACLAAEPDGTRLRLRRPLMVHPLDGGLARAHDLPVGQRADFRLALGAGALCVQDFGSHYEAFLCRGDDTPAAADALAAAAAAGALVALLVGGTREATLVGAVLGAALGRRAG
jgi:hypothetical protein